MTRRCAPWLLLVSMSLLVVVLLPAHARAADPCDFASAGGPTFSYGQVMDCYRRVPFAASDLHNIIQVVRQHRSFSDLAEIYDARVHWRQALAALDNPRAGRQFPDDLAMHDALKHEHKSFRDAHVAYTPPGCYWRMLNAFVPLDFGSTVRMVGGNREQIVFVEGAPILPDLYQSITGIDARTLIGLRVVSINGVPVFDYFRDYGDRQKTHEDDGGELNGVLGAFEYSFRLGGPHDFLPDRAADTYVLESAQGERKVIQLPWLFVRADQTLGPLSLPPSHSTEEFVATCQEGAPSEVQAVAAGLPDPAWGLHGDEVDRHRRHALARLCGQQPPPPPTVGGYQEVATELLGKDIQEIIPPTDAARVIQYGSNVTALQLGDTVGWIDVARRGIEYACQHSDRLIIDVRNNGGGNDTVIRWLHHYLLPREGALVPAGLLPLRLRNDNPVFNEILFNFAAFAEEFLPALGAPPCALFLTPGCLTNIETGGTLSTSGSFDWFVTPSHREVRGGRRLSLSRQFGLPNFGAPVFDSASCAGRFSGANLVILTNGSNASGGYFLPAAFKGPEAVIVNSGGIVGEPMAMGRARGGATFGGAAWAETAAIISEASGGQIAFINPIVGFRRPVETNMEMLGAYREDRRTLHIEDPVEADLHVNVWTTLPGSEGFVYRRALQAVDRHRDPGAD